MRAEASDLDRLIAGIRGCRHCVETPSGKPLPHEPRPVLRVSETARLAVCSQAPGTRVHASGIPFTDPSGDRLRDWMGVSAQEFYDQARIAIIAMGFCFPGQDENGGDLPPRAECSKLWHKSLFDQLAAARACTGGRLLCSSLASRLRGGGKLAGDHARLAPAPAAETPTSHFAASSPVMAQQCVDHAQSVVRGRAAAGAAP